ncbi:MAG: MATE family efflux transporter, partial [Lachnospiraceae bacterium]|nr:MATE family efflux transporter [Lachnospiraceae bacterium]
QQMAVSGMHLYFLGIPFAGCSIAIAVYFTSVCEALPAHMIALLRGFILILPSAFLLSAWFGVNGVWLAFPAAEFLTGMISAVLYIRRAGKKNDRVG